MSLIRAFIAIELNQEIQDKIDLLQRGLRNAPGGRAVSWVRSDGIHLTIKFLGDTLEDRLPAVYDSVKRVCDRTSVFTASIADLGCFPNNKRPRVIWVGIQDNQHSTTQLQQGIENELVSYRFPRENRSFHPHLTLGRVRDSALASEVEAIVRTVADYSAEIGRITVDHVSVVASTLKPQGAEYRILYRANLQKAGVNTY